MKLNSIKLYQRPNGYWEAKVCVDKNDKPTYLYAYSWNAAECVHKLDEKIKSFEKEKEILERCPYLKTAYPSLNEWVECWLDLFCKPKLRPNIYEGYCRNIRMHVLEHLGNFRICDISTVMCQQMFVELYRHGRHRRKKYSRNYGLSEATLASIKKILRRCMQVALEEGLIDKNPVDKVQLPKILPKEYLTLLPDEIGIFLDVARLFNMHEFFMLELSTGLRMGEILALEWQDFDYDNQTITINKQLQTINGVDTIIAPKTINSNRTIKISSECCEELKALKENQKSDSSIMFQAEDGGYLKRKYVLEILHAIQDSNGLTRTTFHGLRHTFATIAVSQNLDVKTISHMLGHTDAGFTMNTYMSVTDDMQVAVANSMQSLIQSKMEEEIKAGT